eukprot:Lithocolla_globosa_v1_NODE_3497_length_1656_cov_5.501562.p1 type:complete len:450 gc:universal NODE_3497_length_1656_cov_5.501562:1610-261(-)
MADSVGLVSGLKKKKGSSFTMSAPDRGFAWLALLGSFVFNFVIGISYNFGVYLNEYQNTYPEEPVFKLSLIGGFTDAVMFFAMLFVGIFVDAFGYWVPVAISIPLLVGGYALAGISTSVWQLYLTQGLMVGLGSALSYIPSVSIISDWFVDYRGFMVGVSVSAIGLGGFVMAPVQQWAIDELGTDWSLFIVAILSGVLMLLVLPTFQRRVDPLLAYDSVYDSDDSDNEETNKNKRPAARAPFSWSELRNIFDLPFIVFFLGMMYSAIPYLIPFYYMASYAESLGLSTQTGAWALSLLSLGSSIGRIVMGFLTTFFGSLPVFVFSMVCAGILLCMWTLFTSSLSLLCFSFFTGFFLGAYFGVFPVIIMELWDDRVPTRIGILYSGSSVGYIFGPLLGGIVLEKYGYVALSLFSGVCFIVLGIHFWLSAKLFKRSNKRPNSRVRVAALDLN